MFFNKILSALIFLLICAPVFSADIAVDAKKVMLKFDKKSRGDNMMFHNDDFRKRNRKVLFVEGEDIEVVAELGGKEVKDSLVIPAKVKNNEPAKTFYLANSAALSGENRYVRIKGKYEDSAWKQADDSYKAARRAMKKYRKQIGRPFSYVIFDSGDSEVKRDTFWHNYMLDLLGNDAINLANPKDSSIDFDSLDMSAFLVFPSGSYSEFVGGYGYNGIAWDGFVIEPKIMIGVNEAIVRAAGKMAADITVQKQQITAAMDKLSEKDKKPELKNQI